MGTTTTARTVPDLSAYRVIYVFGKYSNGSIRGCLTLPYDFLKLGQENYTVAPMGNVSVMPYWLIQYVSDTSVKNWASDGGVNKMILYGQK